MATTKANRKAKRILELYVSEENLAPIDFGSVTPSDLILCCQNSTSKPEQ